MQQFLEKARKLEARKLLTLICIICGKLQLVALKESFSLNFSTDFYIVSSHISGMTNQTMPLWSS